MKVVDGPHTVDIVCMCVFMPWVYVCTYVSVCSPVYACALSYFIVLFTQGKQGEIKHVYRGSVFIQSRNLVENGGLIVAKARHVELAGGTGVVSSCFFM